jgi:glucose-6-phosphate 1-epimerase
MTDTSLCTIDRIMLDELVCWRVRTPHGEACVAEQGAHLLRYRPTDQPPLVWLSEQAAFRLGESPRGGVPVCWPWFGDLARNPHVVRAEAADMEDPPKHGVARTQLWTLTSQSTDAEGATLVFTLDLPDGLDGWPHSARAALTMRFDTAVTLSLTTLNRGTAPLSMTQALHTYFAVSDVHAVSVDGFDGTHYIDTLDDWREKPQAGPIRFTGETDRIYQGFGGHATIHDPGWRRTIQIHTQGSASAIVWNPWIDKARRLSQFDDEAWRGMLCIETARAAADLLTLEPGAAHTLSVRLTVEPDFAASAV